MLADQMFDKGDSAVTGEIATWIVISTVVTWQTFTDVLECLLTVAEDDVFSQLSLLVELLIASTLDHIDVEQQGSRLLDVLREGLLWNQVVIHPEMFDEVDPRHGGVPVTVRADEDFLVSWSNLLELVYQVLQYNMLSSKVFRAPGFLADFALPGYVRIIVGVDLDRVLAGPRLRLDLFLLLLLLSPLFFSSFGLVLIVNDEVSDVRYLDGFVPQSKMS